MQKMSDNVHTGDHNRLHLPEHLKHKHLPSSHQHPALTGGLKWAQRKHIETGVNMRISSQSGAMAATGVLVLALAACGKSQVYREPGTSPTPVAARSSGAKPGQSITVQRGDTVYRLAVSNGISPLDLAVWNGITPPYTIYPGQRLRLYPAEAGTSGTPGGASRSAVRPTQAPPQPAAPPPADSPFKWRWPTEGAIITRFTAGEATRQGIDIGGRSGQLVYASADGVVVYSGSGLVGYGELVIIKHDEQWLSAYGHNRTRLVNEGATVKAGEPIAEMGRTGAARDMLHFEIRYNGRPVDPLRYLPTR